jgi:hypothetical protein
MLLNLKIKKCINQGEINAITTIIGNLVFPRVDIKSDMMLLNFLRTIWPNMNLPYKYEYELESNF